MWPAVSESATRTQAYPTAIYCIFLPDQAFGMGLQQESGSIMVHSVLSKNGHPGLHARQRGSQSPGHSVASGL